MLFYGNILKKIFFFCGFCGDFKSIVTLKNYLNLEKVLYCCSGWIQNVRGLFVYSFKVV